MATARPLIAINGLLEGGDAPKLSLRTRYAEAVLRAGGVPVAIPPVGGPRDVERLLERVDGLLLSGGDDFDTQHLGLGPTHPAAVPTPVEKQDFDLELARAALARDVPTLAVCYGMQLVALADRAADLLQHLPDDRPGGASHAGVVHDVLVAPESKLARLLGVERVPVVSRHHQALDAVRAPWRVAAVDAEGLVEAIEHTGRRFAIGVQWHPELAEEGTPHDRLFRGLVAAAGLAAAGRAARSRDADGVSALETGEAVHDEDRAPVGPRERRSAWDRRG